MCPCWYSQLAHITPSVGMSPLAIVKHESLANRCAPGPADDRHADLVGDGLQREAVVGDERSDDHDAALLDEPLVALDHLAVVLARQAARVGGDECDRAAAPHAFVHRVLEGEDRRVEPVGQQLTEVHVDEDPDLHRLERIALRLHAAGRRIDDDLGHGALADGAAALVPGAPAPPAPSRLELVLKRTLHTLGRAGRCRDRRARGTCARRTGGGRGLGPVGHGRRS